jgi:uncharacterized protein YndB with AHSA1/START domain
VIRRLFLFVLGGLTGAFLLDRWLGGMRLDEGGRPVVAPILTEVEVDAPIAAVWAVLVDIERQPEWMLEMKAVRLVTPGPIGVGTRGEADVRIFGLGVSDPVEVVEFVPPFRFGIAHRGLFSGSGSIALDTLDGGRRTRVAWAETLVPPVFPSLGGHVQAPVLRRIFQADLDRLAAIVEADQDADRDAGRDADRTRTPTRPA